MPSFPTFSISKFERNARKPMYPLMHLFYRVVKTRYSQLKGGQQYWKSHFTIGDSFPTLVDSFMENIQLPIELLKRMVSVSSTTNSCCLQTPESRIHFLWYGIQVDFWFLLLISNATFSRSIPLWTKITKQMRTTELNEFNKCVLILHTLYYITLHYITGNPECSSRYSKDWQL